MTAPDFFERALNAFDPLLSVRRGKALNKWIIERKGYIGDMELKYLRSRRDRAFRIAAGKQDAKERARTYDLACQIAEEADCAERGKRVIVFVDELNDRVFDALALGDTRRYGGFSRFITELEEKEERQMKDDERMAANQREALHKDTYEKLAFIWSHRETQLLDGKRNMSELLR